MSAKLKPSEKRLRVPSSEEEGEWPLVGDDAGDAMLKNILERLEKLDIMDQIYERLTKIEADSKELKDKIFPNGN